MLHEYNHGGDECQARERERDSAPVFSQGPLCRLGRCASRGLALQHYPKHSHGLGDIFYCLLAEVLVGQTELVADLFMHLPGDTDATRVGEAFEAGGHVDAIAVDLLAIDHHVAEVDPDTKVHPAIGQRSVLGLERALNLHGALDCVHDAGELGVDTVTGGIDEAPMMPLDERID